MPSTKHPLFRCTPIASPVRAGRRGPAGPDTRQASHPRLVPLDLSGPGGSLARSCRFSRAGGVAAPELRCRRLPRARRCRWRDLWLGCWRRLAGESLPLCGLARLGPGRLWHPFPTLAGVRPIPGCHPGPRCLTPAPHMQKAALARRPSVSPTVGWSGRERCERDQPRWNEQAHNDRGRPSCSVR